MSAPHILIYGDPVSGFVFDGPFDDEDSAIEADLRHGVMESTIAPLNFDHEVKWENPLIQFARLICEVDAAGGFDNAMFADLRDSMDLDNEQIVLLLDRATAFWDACKEAL